MNKIKAMISLDTLKPNDRNPRKISDSAFKKLCQSIKRDPKFMELRPIIVDGNGKIIGGNQRYKACLAIGKKEIPTSWVLTRSDLTPSQKRRFVLIDNSPDGISGTWDYPILQKDYTQPELMDLGFEIDEQAAQFAGIKCRSLKPYTMVHVLISASIKRIDVIQKVLDKLEGIEGVEIEKSAN